MRSFSASRSLPPDSSSADDEWLLLLLMVVLLFSVRRKMREKLNDFDGNCDDVRGSRQQTSLNHRRRKYWDVNSECHWWHSASRRHLKKRRTVILTFNKRIKIKHLTLSRLATRPAGRNHLRCQKHERIVRITVKVAQHLIKFQIISSTRRKFIKFWSCCNYLLEFARPQPERPMPSEFPRFDFAS